ncbi:MAG TPA: MBL fold metallo-hydrolase, partial [Dehalococcoidia bacterium]|nr:MBL fold metallo-hydrolase [Dehalococcoidia bacterium]
MGNFHKKSVGNAELISVQDTWAAIPPTAFFDSTAAGDWDAYQDLTDNDGNLTLNIGAWLVISEGKTILVDTGLGGRPAGLPAKVDPALPSVMEEAGVKPTDVDLVVFTHLHFDHTGWNTRDENGTPVLVFPNARHVVQQVEWDYWTGSDELRQGSAYDNVLAPIEAAGLLDLVEGEHAVTSEVVTLPTPGHTPGHVSFVVSSGGETAFLIGDAAHQPVQLTKTDWCPGADIDKDTSTKSRHALFDRIE